MLWVEVSGKISGLSKNFLGTVGSVFLAVLFDHFPKLLSLFSELFNHFLDSIVATQAHVFTCLGSVSNKTLSYFIIVDFKL